MQNMEIQQGGNSHQKGEATVPALQSSSLNKDRSTSEDNAVIEQLMNHTDLGTVQGQNHSNHVLHDDNSTMLFRSGRATIGRSRPGSKLPESQSNPESPSVKPSMELSHSPPTSHFRQEDSDIQQRYHLISSQPRNTHSLNHLPNSRDITSAPTSLSNTVAIPRERDIEGADMQNSIMEHIELGSPVDHDTHIHSSMMHSSPETSNVNPRFDSVSLSQVPSGQPSGYNSPDHLQRELSTSTESQISFLPPGVDVQYYPSNYAGIQHNRIDHNAYLGGYPESYALPNSSVQPSYANNGQHLYRADQMEMYDDSVLVHNGSSPYPQVQGTQSNPDPLASRFSLYSLGYNQSQSMQRGMRRGQSPLCFQSFEEWDARRNPLNPPNPPRHGFDLGDSNIPRTKETQIPYILELRDAMRDMTQAEDNPGMRDTWDRLSTRVEDIESACWEILVFSTVRYTTQILT